MGLLMNQVVCYIYANILLAPGPQILSLSLSLSLAILAISSFLYRSINIIIIYRIDDYALSATADGLRNSISRALTTLFCFKSARQQNRRHPFGADKNETPRQHQKGIICSSSQAAHVVS